MVKTGQCIILTQNDTTGMNLALNTLVVRATIHSFDSQTNELLTQ